MHNFNDILTTALTILSIATLAGLGLLRGTVTNLREQLTDERGANESLRRDRSDDRALISQLQTDLAALSRVVTGEAHWVALGEQLDVHHSEASEFWRNNKQQLEMILLVLQGRAPS